VPICRFIPVLRRREILFRKQPCQGKNQHDFTYARAQFFRVIQNRVLMKIPFKSIVVLVFASLYMCNGKLQMENMLFTHHIVFELSN